MTDALVNAMKSLRSDVFDSDVIGVAQISSPIPVQENVYEWDFLGDYTNGERVVVYDLISVEQEKYAKKPVIEVSMGVV